MWIATNEGWISVVKRRGTNQLLVRARKEEHLIAMFRKRCSSREDGRWHTHPDDADLPFKERRGHPDYPLSQEIFVDPDADYPYRMYITRTVFRQIMNKWITDIDYDNFKASVPDPTYARALNDVWYTMYQWGIPHRPEDGYTTLDDYGMVYDNERIAYEEE